MGCGPVSSEGVFATPAALFRTLAIAEAVSWTLLIAGLVARAALGWDLAVTIGGGIHGFVFLSYGATAILVALHNRWHPGPTVVAVVAAIIPYATVPVEIWLQRRGLLRGHWRLDAAADERWYDPALRWFLRHPGVLVAAIAGAVVVLFVVLLMLGPPGGTR